jgi:hypothetical protein
VFIVGIARLVLILVVVVVVDAAYSAAPSTM